MRALARWISPEALAAKVPQIGVLFWVVKLLTTAGGEAVSDYLAHNVLIGAAVDRDNARLSPQILNTVVAGTVAEHSPHRLAIWPERCSPRLCLGSYGK
jgi:uncharacterized membrane-anchored protein